MRNKVCEKMLVFFVLENPLKSLHKDFVYRTLKENFELDDKTLGYDFRPESFFPTSWGGSRLYENTQRAHKLSFKFGPKIAWLKTPKIARETKN